MAGHRLKVRLHSTHLDAWLGGVKVFECERLHASAADRHPKRIDWRHMLPSLKRKPGAFARWVLRDAMFPRSEYAQAWEHLSAKLPERSACRLMVDLLELAGLPQGPARRALQCRPRPVLGGVAAVNCALGASLLVGFLGYGLSLTLFVVGLRTLGTARTGAYLSVAPLFGVVISWALWPEPLSALFWAAAALMGLGVWLHVRERHQHEHTHEPLAHTHQHHHDDHHRHEHDFAWNGAEPHVHPHRHEVLTDKHPHYPDIHHRHGHSH